MIVYIHVLQYSSEKQWCVCSWISQSLAFQHSPDARNHRVSSFAPKACKTILWISLFKSGNLAGEMSSVFVYVLCWFIFHREWSERGPEGLWIFNLHFYCISSRIKKCSVPVSSSEFVPYLSSEFSNQSFRWSNMLRTKGAKMQVGSCYLRN